MKKITSFTHHTTAEGERVTFTYSIIDAEGNILKSNARATTIVMDENILKKIEEINDFLYGKIPE